MGEGCAVGACASSAPSSNGSALAMQDRFDKRKGRCFCIAPGSRRYRLRDLLDEEQLELRSRLRVVLIHLEPACRAWNRSLRECGRVRPERRATGVELRRVGELRCRTVACRI